MKQYYTGKNKNDFSFQEVLILNWIENMQELYTRKLLIRTEKVKASGSGITVETADICMITS